MFHKYCLMCGLVQIKDDKDFCFRCSKQKDKVETENLIGLKQRAKERMNKQLLERYNKNKEEILLIENDELEILV